MIITKHTEKKVEIPYFFCKGLIENINSAYFIQKIEEGIRSPDNQNYITNVKGEITSWDLFNDYF